MADYWGAVIGAAGVLAGGLLTGGFTLLKGQQDRRERDLDRIEQRRVLHRNTRRAAYLDFLNAYSDLDHSIDGLWLQVPPADVASTPAEFAEYDRLESALLKAEAALALEGPPEVAVAARSVAEAFGGEGRAVANLLRRHVGTQQMPLNVALPSERETTAIRERSFVTFLEEARRALGGDAPAFG